MSAALRNTRLLVSLLIALTISPAVYAGRRVINPHQKRGPEAAEHVRKLLAANAHLQTAFDRMQGRGLHPRIDDAVVVSGTAVPVSGTATSKSLKVGTNEVVAGDNVELDFIPAYIAPGYWEGTVDARRYDEYGNVTAEYVGNVVMSSPDPDTAFDVGYEDQVYYDPGPGDPTPELVYVMSEPGARADRGSRNHGPDTASAQDSTRKGTSLGWRGRWGAWGKCSLAWCGGAAAGCGVGNWWNAEIAWGPCTAIGCIGGAIGCTYGTLWD